MNGPVKPYKRKLNSTWNKHLKPFMKRQANKILRRLGKDTENL